MIEYTRTSRKGQDYMDDIFKRQTGRLLEHLEDTNQLTPRLRSDLLRSMRYIKEDIEKSQQTGDGQDENTESTSR